jgi:hypothetical protein
LRCQSLDASPSLVFEGKRGNNPKLDTALVSFGDARGEVLEVAFEDLSSAIEAALIHGVGSAGGFSGGTLMVRETSDGHREIRLRTHGGRAVVARLDRASADQLDEWAMSARKRTGEEQAALARSA